MRANLIVAFFIISLILLTPATARTYRWVDEYGHTVYSQKRPPSGKATIIKPPPPAPTSEPSKTMDKLKARLDAINNSSKEKNDAKEKENAIARNAEIKEKNCKIAKNNLADLELQPRVRMKMNDGSYKRLSDEERTAEIEKTKKAMEKYCK